MRLGELLIKAKVINELQLKAALAEQARWGGKLGEILVRMNVVTEEVVVKALSKLLNVPRVDLDQEPVPPREVAHRIPHDVASDMGVVPLRLEQDGRLLVVAMGDPANIRQLDSLRAVSKCKISPMLAGATQIARMLAKAYEGEAELSPEEGGFKVVDAQGRTIIKPLAEISGAPKPAAAAAPAPAPPPIASAPPPASLPTSNPTQLIQSLEDAQRKEVAALRAIVDLLIEKGVFTKDEYIARVRR